MQVQRYEALEKPALKGAAALTASKLFQPFAFDRPARRKRRKASAASQASLGCHMQYACGSASWVLSAAHVAWTAQAMPEGWLMPV